MTTFSSLASVYAQLTNFAISVEQSATLVSDTVVGDFGTVWVSDNYAYVGNNDSGVQIFDISNPFSPVLKSNYGSYDIPSEGFNAQEIEVVGNYAYIASWDRGLKILDISDRGNPVSIATLAIPGQSYGTTGLQVVGNYAYVTNINSGLSIIDITNPSNPTLKGSYAGEGWDVQVIGDYAYIANGYSGLQIVNISDPTAPTLVSNFLGSQFYRQRGIEVVGTYAYVASELQGLLIIDISNPSAPILKGTYDTPGEAVRVSVVGNYAYVADDTYGLQIVNISNPTNPTLAENYDTSGSVADVKVIGDYAYVADGVGGLKIIDVSDLTANPIGTGVISFSNSQFSVNEDGTPITQVTLTRTEGSTGEVSVTLNLSDGTATEGNDYNGTPITVIFADGETSKTVNLTQASPSQGLSFDGNSYVNVGNQPSLVVSNAITMQAWINPTGAGISSYPGVGGAFINKQGEYQVFRFADGTIRWAFTNTDPGWFSINTGYVAPLNEWTNITVTYDLGLIKTYANGVLVHTYNGAGNIGDFNDATNEFEIGRSLGDESYFQGSIDDVRIWNKARTQAEIQADFNRELTGKETGLVGYWNFNSVNGNTVQDLTSNHNDGTLVGAQSTTGIVPTSLIINDKTYEGDETLNLTLSNPTNGATLGTQQTATVTIVDNEQLIFADNFDNGASSLWGNEVGNWQQNQGFYDAQNPNNTPLTYSSLPYILKDFSIELDINNVQDGGIFLRSTDNNNGVLLVTGGEIGTGTGFYWHIIQDGVVSGILNPSVSGLVQPGISNIHLKIEVVGDNYSVLLNNDLTPITTLTTSLFSSGKVALYDFSGLQTFDNVKVYSDVQTNAGVIFFSSPQFSVNEDGTLINQVTLTRTEGSTGEVSVTLNLTDGTATAGSDYDGTPITVTFADGETSKIVNIPIVDDTLYEGDETVNLTLSNPTNGATLGMQTTASLTIIGNDVNNAPTVINNIANQQSNTNQLFTFTLPTNIFIDPDGDTLSYNTPNSLDIINVSLASENWNIYSPYGGGPAVVETTPTGLRFYGSGYRQGTLINSKLYDDFTDSTVNIKWQANGGNGYPYSAFSLGINPDILTLALSCS
jgi:hypothetical protein